MAFLFFFICKNTCILGEPPKKVVFLENFPMSVNPPIHPSFCEIWEHKRWISRVKKAISGWCGAGLGISHPTPPTPKTVFFGGSPFFIHLKSELPIYHHLFYFFPPNSWWKTQKCEVCHFTLNCGQLLLLFKYLITLYISHKGARLANKKSSFWWFMHFFSQFFVVPIHVLFPSTS